jgi:hypothetical protein
VRQVPGVPDLVGDRADLLDRPRAGVGVHPAEVRQPCLERLLDALDHVERDVLAGSGERLLHVRLGDDVAERAVGLAEALLPPLLGLLLPRQRAAVEVELRVGVGLGQVTGDGRQGLDLEDRAQRGQLRLGHQRVQAHEERRRGHVDLGELGAADAGEPPVPHEVRRAGLQAHLVELVVRLGGVVQVLRLPADRGELGLEGEHQLGVLGGLLGGDRGQHEQLLEVRPVRVALGLLFFVEVVRALRQAEPALAHVQDREAGVLGVGVDEHVEQRVLVARGPPAEQAHQRLLVGHRVDRGPLGGDRREPGGVDRRLVVARRPERRELLLLVVGGGRRRRPRRRS